MNIYAKNGDKVRYLDDNGIDWEREKYKKLGLKKGDILTVERTDVGNWSTDVYFHEYGPDQYFNSVCFEDYKGETMDRVTQFKHERLFNSKGELLAKGGRTIAFEVPTLEEFNAMVPSFELGLPYHLGIAECSKKDHYNRKLGRNIALGRMKITYFFVTAKSETEVQLSGGGVVLILRKHKNSDRIYFEEVV